MPYFDYPDNVYINPYYLDVTPDIRREMKFRAALYGTKTRSVGVTYGNMYDSIVSTKNIEWPYQKVPWAVITSLFDKKLQLGLSYDKEMSDNQGNLTLYSSTRNAPAKPLLTSVEISNEGQRGSLLKGKFAFTYFPELTPTGLDLEQLQQAFFTPGRRVHIAFGWSTYAQVPRVNKLEFAGVIFGFNWTFNPNMSISAEVQIVSPSSLAIGFSGDQTYDDDGDVATSATGDELPKATNLLTVIEKDLRGQKGDVELDSGTLVSWLPKKDTVTNTFDYVLVKLPITGFSSYLESSAANLQDVEWTGREPDTVIVTPGEVPPGGGGGIPDGGSVPEKDTFEDDSGQLKFVSGWMKTVKSWIMSSLTTGVIKTKPSGEGVDPSDWVLADPNSRNINEGIGKQYNPSHSSQLIRFKKDIELLLNKSQDREWLTDDEGLIKKYNDKSIGLSKNWGRWVQQGKNGEFNNPNYVGGIRLTRIMALLKEYDDNNSQMINILNDLINIKRLEELQDFKMYRVYSKKQYGTNNPLYYQDKNGNSIRNRDIYPDGWVGAGFDEEKIFDQYMSITVGDRQTNFESSNIMNPLNLLNKLPRKTVAGQLVEDTNGAVEDKINSWIKILQKKISPEIYGPLEKLSDDRVEAAKKEGIGNKETEADVRKALTQFKKEWFDYRRWLVGRNARQLDEKGNKDPDYDKYKNKETTVGDVDIETIEQNIPKAEQKIIGGGVDTIKDRSNQEKWISEIMAKIDLIQERYLPNGEPNPDYRQSYENAVIYGKDSAGNEFFKNKSTRFQQKKNQAPSSSPGAGGTGPTTEVIQGQKIKEDRTYWYITLGDLVNFTNNLIDKYTINDEKKRYTFPYFNMVAFGNETDYNKNLKSAYPVDVYFPDKIMGNYGTFQPFSAEPFSDLQRTFFISEKKGETPSQEKKAKVASDVINIGQILIGIDYIRKTYRNFLHDNSTNIAYKNITSFFEDIIKRINLASGDIYQLTVMLFEEPEKLTNKETSPKDPLSTGDDGTKRRALLSIEDSNLARKHTQMMDEDDDDLISNDPRDYYVVTPYRFDANIMKPLIRNVSLTSRPSKEATFAAYIAARGEEGYINNQTTGKAPPMSVDVDLTKPEYKDIKEYEKQYVTNYKEKIKLENMAQSDGFNERWSDTYRGVLTKMKRLTYKPNMKTEESAATETDPKAGSTDQTGAHWLNMAIYPIELTLTIDGINGFKFGDVIRTTMIPSHYNTRWKVVFTITKIIHKVTPSAWETTLHTAARLPLDDPNTGIAEVGKVQPATAFNSYGPSQDQLQKKK